MAEFTLDKLVLGDCIDVLRTFPDALFDSIVTDPPYGLGNKEPEPKDILSYLQGGNLDTGGDFMGKDWEIPPLAVWRECYRVLKPGGHLISFGGTRTFDLISLAIRMAGFESRDSIASCFNTDLFAYVHGQGFPKSMNVGKALDKGRLRCTCRVEAEPLPIQQGEPWPKCAKCSKPIIPDGLGTALKPSWESISVYRKPPSFEGLIERVTECLTELSVRLAKTNSPSSHQGSNVGSDSAPSDVGRNSVTRDGSSDPMAMLPSGWEMVLNLNIVSSWQNIWDDLLALSKTSTIETDVELTTELRILNSFLWGITPKYMHGVETSLNGLKWIVSNAVKSFSAVSMRLNDIRCLSAHGSAIEKAHRNSPEEGEARLGVEPIAIFRKPLQESSVLGQILATGTGALNIDVTRVAGQAEVPGSRRAYRRFDDKGDKPELEPAPPGHPGGRWPSNLVLCHTPECKKVGTQTVAAPVINRFTDGMKPFGNGAGHAYTSSGGGTEEIPVYECVEGCPVRMLDEQSGNRKSTGDHPSDVQAVSNYRPNQGAYQKQGPLYKDAGGASRFYPQFEGQAPPIAPFFYTSKAAKKEKNAGLVTYIPGFLQLKDDLTDEEMEDALDKMPLLAETDVREFNKLIVPEEAQKYFEQAQIGGNLHSTVKPLPLMEWLVKLVCPPGGVVLDPYSGSGTTLVAAIIQGMHFVGIEKNPDYVKIAEARLVPAMERRSEEDTLTMFTQQAEEMGEGSAVESLASIPTPKPVHPSHVAPKKEAKPKKAKSYAIEQEQVVAAPMPQAEPEVEDSEARPYTAEEMLKLFGGGDD